MDYKRLADHSRVWIYQSDRVLSDEEVTEINNYGKQFIQNWSAHGSELEAAFEVFHHRFIVLFADESKVLASGCSIDSSVRFIKDIQNAYQLNLFDRLNIAFMQSGRIDTMRMTDFQTALDSAKLKPDTLVFNNLVETKKEFEESWVVPLKDSWHKQML